MASWRQQGVLLSILRRTCHGFRSFREFSCTPPWRAGLVGLSYNHFDNYANVSCTESLNERGLCQPQVVTVRYPSRIRCATDSSVINNTSNSEKNGTGNENIRQRLHILPACLLAFSLFSKKKDEVEEAKEKLKNVDELDMFLRRAKLAELKKQWKEANELYHQALALLNLRHKEKIWDEEKVVKTQIYIYDKMANLALSDGRLNEAEKLYKETIKGLLTSGMEKDDNAIIEISLKLAMIYAMQQRKDDAEAGYAYCTSAQEAKLDRLKKDQKKIDEDTLALLGMCINSYSRFLILHHKLDEAEKALQKTVNIATKVLPAEHEQLAVLYSDLATVATMRKDYACAKPHIQKAIDIGRHVGSPDVATFLCNKGLICMERGEMAEAEHSCHESLRLAQKLKEKDIEEEAKRCLQQIKERKQKK